MRIATFMLALACSTGAAQQASSSARHADAVKVTVLSTMLVGAREKGVGEWGFAALLEVDGRRLLIDTGERPDTVLNNAKELGVDLSEVTDVVLTHSHDDHTGGLITLRRELRKRKPNALSRAHVAKDFFATRVYEGKDEDETGLRKAYEALGGVFVEHAGPEELAPNVWFTGPVPRPNDEHNWGALGMIRRGAKLVEDTVPEDSSIVVDMPEGLLVVTGCGHAGIVNISQYASGMRNHASINAVLGGLHLFNQPDERATWTGAKLKGLGVKYLLGSHCTGIEAVRLLRDAAGLTRSTAAVGTVGASFTRGKGIETLPLAR